MLLPLSLMVSREITRNLWWVFAKPKKGHLGIMIFPLIIMEPSFTVLKGSKKMAHIRKLESGLPMKRKRHLCCSTCVGDHTYSPLCCILEDKQDLCFCQQAKGIKEHDELDIVGDKKLVYMERVGLPMKSKRHFCCIACVKDDTHSLFGCVLEYELDVCHCQHAKDIKEV